MTTNFILSIQDVLIDVDIHVLKSGYEEFASFVLSESINIKNNNEYLNALVYTRLELLDLEKDLEKKSERISE